jgi:hypothetical protein
LKRAASKDPDVSSEPSNGVKKAKKVGTTDPTTAELASVGATEPASDRVELHNDVALQQEHAKSKDVKKTSDTEAQQLNNVAPADDRSEDESDSPTVATRTTIPKKMSMMNPTVMALNATPTRAVVWRWPTFPT